MPFNVNDIRAQLSGGGARPNLFEVQLPFPAIASPGNASTKFTFTCKGSNIPASTIAEVPVSYFGRIVKLAGNRTFDTWTTTVINDEDFSVYNAVQTWMNSINSHSGNIRESGAGPSSYQADADIIQFGKDGSEIKRITVVNMWPSTLASLPLDWSTEGLQDFEVTWTYDYWTAAGITS